MPPPTYVAEPLFDELARRAGLEIPATTRLRSTACIFENATTSS
jgi:hypothetical protein